MYWDCNCFKKDGGLHPPLFNDQEDANSKFDVTVKKTQFFVQPIIWNKYMVFYMYIIMYI